MQIGGVNLTGKTILAPMAGVTDPAFRRVCRAHGAALTVTEMVSAKALHFKDKKTPGLLRIGAEEHPSSAQIFGSEPETMAEGARIALALSGCDMIDINMGCPAPKIVNNGDGSALMRDPHLAGQIVEAVKKAVDCPVTVKFRKGWDADHVNCTEFARVCEAAGADLIAVHGRTRAQQYEGKADWDAIRAVREAVRIPLAANGDVFSAEDAVNILAQTGADLVMIGRGSLGNPWLFEQVNAALEGREIPPKPDFCTRIDTAVQQIEWAAADKSERVALLEARRHVNWYLTGVRGAKPYKARISQLTTLDELHHLADEMKEALAE